MRGDCFMVASGLGVGRMAAGRFDDERKVRALQDRVVGNADRPRGQGKCNRKYTADGRPEFARCGSGKGETVR